MEDKILNPNLINIDTHNNVTYDLNSNISYNKNEDISNLILNLTKNVRKNKKNCEAGF